MDSHSLIASSTRWMTAGLEVFTEGTDTGFAVHHFGVATEHLLKGYLSSYHPALIVDATDFPGLLHATGHGPHASTALPDAKTITALEAFRRSNHLLKPKLIVPEPAFKAFLNVRNGVSHMGAHVPDRARATLITAISIVDPLLAALDVQLAAYWGNYMDLHAELLAKRADDLKISYQMKIAAARHMLATRRGDVDAQIFAMVATELDPCDDDEEPADCPVCGATGRLGGHISIERMDDGDPTDYANSDWAVMLYPFAFQCPVCRLQLEASELSLAGLPTEVRTKHEPEEWAMPDEDMYRDR